MSTQSVKYQKTQVPVERSVGEVSDLIRRYGGSRFEQLWSEDGSVTGVRFAIRHPEIGELPVSLTVKSGGVERILRTEGYLSGLTNKVEREKRIVAQAQRIAWRHTKDLTEQLLLSVQLEMRSLPAAFMAEIEAHDESTGETITMQELFRRRARLGAGGRVELPPTRSGHVPMTYKDAAAFMEEHSNIDRGYFSPENPRLRESIESAYRSAAKKLHPDAGGDPDEFKRLQEARDVLLGKEE